MPHSHHTHSGQFCRHAAQGTTLEDVVKQAISKGFEVYGLSEHAPRYRQEDLYPEESDLNPEELEKTYLSFLDEAYRLKALYASKITLLVGMETDYITETDLIKTTEWIRNQKGRIQYIVGSLHHVLETPIDFDKPAYDDAVITSGSVPPNLSQFLEHYFESQYRMLQTLKPQVVGHFDLCRLYTPEIRLDEYKSVWELVKRNISFIISYGGLFEVNAASFRKGWETAYPGIEVLKLILENNGRLCLSDDSHGPQAVGLNYLRMRKYLVESDVKDIWYLAENDSGAVEARKFEGDWAQSPFWDLQTS